MTRTPRFVNARDLTSPNFLPETLGALPDDAPPEHDHDLYPPIERSNWVGAMELFAHVAIAGLTYYVVHRTTEHEIVALALAVIYFGSMTAIGKVIWSGGLSTLIAHHYRHKSYTYNIDARAELVERYYGIVESQLLPVVAPELEQHHAEIADNYTPSHGAVVDAAMTWMLELYDKNGRLKPNRIRSGYIQGGVIGSKREGKDRTSVEARNLLIAQRVIRQDNGGYKFNVKRFPTVDHARALDHHLRAVQG